MRKKREENLREFLIVRIQNFLSIFFFEYNLHRDYK